MTHSLRSNVQILLPEQTSELLDLHVRVLELGSPLEALQGVVDAIARIVDVKTALVSKESGVWTVQAESGDGPAIPPIADTARDVFDRVGDAPAVAIEIWTSSTGPWTLIGLTRRSATPAVLMLDRDWELSASTLRQLGEGLLLAERVYGLSTITRSRIATHRLTRALARATGYAGVADVAVRNVARAVHAQLVALAIAEPDTRQLRIMATHGYPLKLVDHLRIEPGSGVIGSVYETGLPLRVRDVTAFHGERKRRSRYRTKSFAAVPVASGSEVLGVLCVTDRADGLAFTQGDLSTLRTLSAPLALAISRERVRAQADSYAHAAAIDPVSGLFNRRYFHARLEEELQRAHRHALSVGLLMVDVDDFKSINDRYGHLVGDAVIRAIADILRRSVRVFDVCTRFGGEEFAVVMPGSGAEDAGRIAERIRQRVQNYTPADPGLASLKITVSVGFAVSQLNTSPHDLISSADVALYEAKRTGKNQVRAASADASMAAFGPGRTEASRLRPT